MLPGPAARLARAPDGLPPAAAPGAAADRARSEDAAPQQFRRHGAGQSRRDRGADPNAPAVRRVRTLLPLLREPVPGHRRVRRHAALRLPRRPRLPAEPRRAELVPRPTAGRRCSRPCPTSRCCSSAAGPTPAARSRALGRPRPPAGLGRRPGQVLTRRPRCCRRCGCGSGIKIKVLEALARGCRWSPPRQGVLGLDVGRGRRVPRRRLSGRPRSAAGRGGRPGPQPGCSAAAAAAAGERRFAPEVAGPRLRRGARPAATMTGIRGGRRAREPRPDCSAVGVVVGARLRRPGPDATPGVVAHAGRPRRLESSTA